MEHRAGAAAPANSGRGLMSGTGTLARFRATGPGTTGWRRDPGGAA
jgi:hypothetical protein